MTAPLDTVTVLTTKGPLATKRITAIGNGPPKEETYGKARTFSIAEHPITCFDDLAALLRSLELKPRSFIVRGKPAEGVNRQYALRRLHPQKKADGTIEPATLEPAARRTITLDVDSLPCPDHIDLLFDPDQVVEHVVEHLPPEFHGASFYWQFTAGHGRKPGICMRLSFLADRALADWELTAWLADAPVDEAIFQPAQPIYTAFPLFVGMPDPVPYRSGIWRGDRDAITPPAIEKPSSSRSSAWSASGGQTGGAGYEFHKSRIGDHEGGGGFHNPITSAVAAFIAEHGTKADTAWLQVDLEETIRAACRDKHNDSYIDIRVRDLDTLIRWVVDQQAAKEAVSGIAEPIEPTYPAPLGSVDDAHNLIASAMVRFVDAALAWQPTGADAEDDPEGQPETTAPPVHAVNAEIGTGKTRAWREIVAPRLIAAGRHPALAIPRHKLGDEIVRDLAGAGITGRVYRGREADDPDAPGEKMCRDLARVKEIEGALGNASTHACKSKYGECEFFKICGYQRQRQQRADARIIPHHLLFREKPSFIKCDALTIDESFHNAAVHGIENKVECDINLLIESDRTVLQYLPLTSDLVSISARVHAVLAAQPEGRLSRSAIVKGYITASDAAAAHKMEWQRKREPEVYPGMNPKAAKAACARVAEHNQQIARLARFWRLLKQTIEAPDERSPWLELRHETDRNGRVNIVIAMIWRDDIHKSWRVPTMIMDATMPVEIVRQFFPQMQEPASAPAPMPHTFVRQITDRAMSAAMLIPSPKASDKTNTTRRNNVERLRRYIEVRAAEMRPGCVLVVCQEGLKRELRDRLPYNVKIRHFNDITGENAYSKVALVIMIGRTEPSPRGLEQITRALFGCDVVEVEPDEKGEIHHPRITRGIRMRNGTGRAVEGSQHPDPRGEAVRWSICEANGVQSIGRGRGVNRGPLDPLQIDILTNVVLPIEVDEVTTWEAIQPSPVDVMRARGVVPFGYADMAAGHGDLFRTGEAARKALDRKNPGQMPIERFLIGDCPGFSGIAYYRKRGSRGPPGRAWIDLKRATIAERKATLEAQLGPLEQFAVEIHRAPPAEAAAEPVAADAVAPPRIPACPREELPPEVPDYAGGVMPLAVIAYMRERRARPG